MSLSGTSGSRSHFASKATPRAVRVRRDGQASGKNLVLLRLVGISKANPPVEAKKSCAFVHSFLRSANVDEVYRDPVREVVCCFRTIIG
jgi:hypothetical protein